MEELSPGLISGRWSDLAPDRREVKALQTGFDFRRPEYRREVFLRFYEYHLKYRAHPGAVYYLLPYLFNDDPRNESRLWFAFINGCTQNPVTSTIIYRAFEKVPTKPRQMAALEDWFNANWHQLPFDTDRRYQKKDFPAAVRAYAEWLRGGTQWWAFTEAMGHGLLTDEQRFDNLWKVIQDEFVSFGRLGTWSYMEYLRIMGLPLEPSSMLLIDMSGSKSHRNGLAIVLGRDDLDWKKGGEFQGKYSKEVLAWMERECDALLAEARARAEKSGGPYLGPAGARSWTHDISRFTLESALCTYKGWHRPNRRYPNVYNDMLRDRIEQVQKLWPDENLSVFYRARQAFLPQHLRVEDCPGDPGLARPKQNHYRLTGQVIMMDRDWSVFRNDLTWMEKTT